VYGDGYFNVEWLILNVEFNRLCRQLFLKNEIDFVGKKIGTICDISLDMSRGIKMHPLIHI